MPDEMAMHEFTESGVVIRYDAQGRLDIDVACKGCGYNLRGLDPAGVCAECGREVARSLHIELLRDADPKWLDRIAHGMRWAGASVVLLLLSPVVGVLLLLALKDGELAGYEMVTLCVMATETALAGCWFIASPEPGRSRAEDSRARRWSRAAAAAAQVLIIAATLALVSGKVSWAGATFLLALACMVVCGALGLLQLRRLCQRIPDGSMAAHCRSAAIGLLGGGFLAFSPTLFLLIHAMVVPSRSVGGVAEAILVVPIFCGSLGIVAFGFSAVGGVISSLRPRFRDIAARARRRPEQEGKQKSGD